MPEKSRSATEVADLVLQLGRAAYADCASTGLTQAQWIALRFFSRTNRFSRTVSGFADFHATTRGTASQTVKSLVRNGYLVRRRSERDGRSVQFDLTPMARRRLRLDPLEKVVRAAGALSETQRSRTASGLRAVLGELERSRPCGTVGVCRLCGHRESGDAGSRCRLMEEDLEPAELQELCVRFRAEP